MEDVNQWMLDRMTSEELVEFAKTPGLPKNSLKMALDELGDRGEMTVMQETKQIIKRHKKLMAIVQANPFAMSFETISKIGGNEMIEPSELIEPLRSHVDDLRSNKNNVSEQILASQAATLNALFHKLLQLGLNAKTVKEKQAYMEMAMRSQNQCRKTLGSIEQLKGHSQTFIAQQNIANTQQINNHEPVIKSSIEVLKEASHAPLDC